MPPKTKPAKRSASAARKTAAPPLHYRVELANVLAHALDLAGVENEQVPPLAEPLWRAFALDDAGWEGVFGATEQLFHDMSQTLTT